MMLTPRSIPRPSLRPAPSPVLLARTVQLDVAWARHADDVREARELRRRLGALQTGSAQDEDLADRHADHLLVRARDIEGDRRVVGALRVLAPAGWRRLGGLDLDRAFETVRLRPQAARLAELGPLCVDHSAGEGTVLDLLWFALASTMRQRGLDQAVGAFALPAHDGGQAAAAIFRAHAPARMAPIEQRLTPRHPVALDEARRGAAPAAPSLVLRCLDGGARLLGAPGWDLQAGQPRLPFLLSLPRS